MDEFDNKMGSTTKNRILALKWNMKNIHLYEHMQYCKFPVGFTCGKKNHFSICLKSIDKDIAILKVDFYLINSLIPEMS